MLDKITNIRSPKYSSADHSTIDILFDLHGETMPGTVSSTDSYSQEIYQNAVAGQYGAIAAYVAPPMPVPPSVTRRQAAKQMMAMGIITGPEAIAMTRDGTPPAFVAAMLAGLPTDAARTSATIDFAADSYERGNALFNAMVAGYLATQGVTDPAAVTAETDDFFRGAALL